MESEKYSLPAEMLYTVSQLIQGVHARAFYYLLTLSLRDLKPPRPFLFLFDVQHNELINII